MVNLGVLQCEITVGGCGARAEGLGREVVSTDATALDPFPENHFHCCSERESHGPSGVDSKEHILQLGVSGWVHSLEVRAISTMPASGEHLAGALPPSQSYLSVVQHEQIPTSFLS